MTPASLQRLLGRLPEEIVLEPKAKAAFLDSRCVAAFQRDLLTEMESVWSAILAARSWEEFCSLRGAYTALERLLDLPKDLSVADGSRAATPADAAAEARATMEEGFYGTGQ